MKQLTLLARTCSSNAAAALSDSRGTRTCSTSGICSSTTWSTRSMPEHESGLRRLPDRSGMCYPFRKREAASRICQQELDIVTIKWSSRESRRRSLTSIGVDLRFLRRARDDRRAGVCSRPLGLRLLRSEFAGHGTRSMSHLFAGATSWRFHQPPPNAWNKAAVSA